MKRNIIGRLATLVLAALALGSCALNKTSVEDRIANFLDDLNNDAARTSIYKNLHDDIDDAWKSPTVWEISSFRYGYHPFAFIGMSYGDNYAQGNITSGGPNDTIYFDMKEEESDDWYIYQIKLGGVQVVP